MLFSTNNSIQYYSFVYILLNGFKYCYVSLTIQFSITHLFSLFKCQTVLFDQQIGPYLVPPLGARVDRSSNGNEGVLHIPKSSRARASASGSFVSYLGHPFDEMRRVGSYPTAEIHSAFYSPSWLGYEVGYFKGFFYYENFLIGIRMRHVIFYLVTEFCEISFNFLWSYPHSKIWKFNSPYFRILSKPDI